MEPLSKDMGKTLVISYLILAIRNKIGQASFRFRAPTASLFINFYTPEESGHKKAALRRRQRAAWH
jgi:hypothetical protein